MKRVALKGLLTVSLAVIIGWFCWLLWSDDSQPMQAAPAPPDYVVAYTDIPADSTDISMSYHPAPRNGESVINSSGKDQIQFNYNLRGAEPKSGTVGMAISGTLADSLLGCSNPDYRIERHKSFESLPAVARAALVYLVQQNQKEDSYLQPQTTTQDAATVLSQASGGFTWITFDAAMTSGGADNGGIGVLGGIVCRAELGSRWSGTVDGSRFAVPALGVAAAESKTKAPGSLALKATSSLVVDTDDQFYLAHSSLEPQRLRGTTKTLLQQITSSAGYAGGYQATVADSYAATFSSSSRQQKDRRDLLLIGVLLGAAASLIIVFLSRAFEVVADWLPAFLVRLGKSSETRRRRSRNSLTTATSASSDKARQAEMPVSTTPNPSTLHTNSTPAPSTRDQEAEPLKTPGVDTTNNHKPQTATPTTSTQQR